MKQDEAQVRMWGQPSENAWSWHRYALGSVQRSVQCGFIFDSSNQFGLACVDSGLGLGDMAQRHAAGGCRGVCAYMLTSKWDHNSTCLHIHNLHEPVFEHI